MLKTGREVIAEGKTGMPRQFPLLFTPCLSLSHSRSLTRFVLFLPFPHTHFTYLCASPVLGSSFRLQSPSNQDTVR